MLQGLSFTFQNVLYPGGYIMAKDITNKKEVSGGRLADIVAVYNQNPHPLAAEVYFHIRAQADEIICEILKSHPELKIPQNSELNFLFTLNDLKEALVRSQKNIEDIPKVHWLRDLLD